MKIIKKKTITSTCSKRIAIVRIQSDDATKSFMWRYQWPSTNLDGIVFNTTFTILKLTLKKDIIRKIIEHQLIKLTDAIWLLQLAISSLSFMHWVTEVKLPPGFEPVTPDWEADDLTTQLFYYLF